MEINYIEKSQQNQKRAWEVVRKSRLVPLWEGIGAKVNLVGSLKIGVLAKHLDIDFHIYTPELKLGQSFDIMAQITENLEAKSCQFINLSETQEECFEWHLTCLDTENKLWQIDIIQIKQGSKYDGHFENIAEKIKSLMTEEQKQTILKLKFETPENIKISGMEYYKAVIQDNVKNIDELLKWKGKHQFSGIIEW